MNQGYLGHVRKEDPVYSYFRDEIQPALNRPCADPDYRVFRMHGSNEVYRYEERHTGVQFIGKFFLHAAQRDPVLAERRMEREFNNLNRMRSAGFSGSPHYIARPLGKNAARNDLLVVEYCGGELLSSILKRAIPNHDNALLFGKLTALAYFLSRFHNHTAEPEGVHAEDAAHYADTLLQTLLDQHLLDGREFQAFHQRKHRWWNCGLLREDCQVLVHGDATPDNFMFGDGLHVITFDLERLRRADRVYDLGRIAAELAHFFLMMTGNRQTAEPFLGHFLWEYACHFPDRERAFHSITKRIPFYMGLNFLRIARNDWLDRNYRKQLIHEAAECLGR